MKIIKTIGCLLFILSSPLTIAQILPPEPESPCIGPGDLANFAYVSVIKGVSGLQHCEPLINTVVPTFGGFGGMTTYENGVNSSYFKTTLDISELSPGTGSGYIHFVELSKKSSSGAIPGLQEMIADAIISYNPFIGYSLIVNYQTVIGSDSLVINLNRNIPIFDVTLTWINAGCVHMILGCEQVTGELEIRVDYPNSTIIDSVDGLPYQYFTNNRYSTIGSSTSWQAEAVYWGDLGRENLAGVLRLARP